MKETNLKLNDNDIFLLRLVVLNRIDELRPIAFKNSGTDDAVAKLRYQAATRLINKYTDLINKVDEQVHEQRKEG